MPAGGHGDPDAFAGPRQGNAGGVDRIYGAVRVSGCRLPAPWHLGPPSKSQPENQSGRQRRGRRGNEHLLWDPVPGKRMGAPGLPPDQRHSRGRCIHFVLWLANRLLRAVQKAPGEA